MRIIFMLFLYLSLLFPAALHAASIPLPQTGQSVVDIAKDGSGKSLACPRFNDNGNGTVTDALYGLTWSNDANLIAARNPDSAGTVSWQSALESVAKLNSGNYLGYTDWRLPNVNELASVLTQGEPAITAWLGRQGIINAQSALYWTSTTVPFDAIKAWTINFETGSIVPNSKSSKAYVWAVRGGDAIHADVLALPKTGQSVCYDTMGVEIPCAGTGQDGALRKGAEWPVPRFKENNNETVTDNLTGLIWVKHANLIAIRDPSFGSSSDGRVVWPDALEYVNRLNTDAYLGYADWRLPNRNELISLINYAESNPTAWINSLGFSDAQQHYWSSSTSANTTSNAWNVSIAGHVSERNKYDSVNGSFVWPVRGGLDPPGPASDKAITPQGNPAPVPQVVAAVAAALSVSTGTLPAGTIGTAYSQTLAATGGTSPYTWTRTTGALPAGLALSTAGVISGTPTTAATSTFTVQVKDKSAATATKSLSIVITAPPLSITTASLPDGYLTTAYSQTLTATGGKTAYTWSVTTGALPAGLTLAATTGIISGTPTTPGSSAITIQVKDANNTIATKALTVTVYALPSVTTASLPTGSTGVAYTQTLAATGGKPAITWSVSSGTLPAGLVLNAGTGGITGTPSATGTSSVTFKITDANAKTATKALSIVINATPPAITTTALANGYPTVSYSQTLAAAGGKTPYTWSRTTGSLPTGLSLSTAGVISGTPTTAGTSSFTVQVKDGNNSTATATLTITIVPAVSISTTTLPAGSVGGVYNQTLLASGGLSPYTWSITGGALPAGLSLNTATGAITGIPTTAGVTSFTVQAKDGNNKTATGSLSITINLPLSISTATLHDNFVGIAYSTALSATGGLPPYSWSIAGGVLPAGLALDSTSGVISGVPTVIGASSCTIKVTDSNNASASSPVTIAITGFGSINGVITDQTTGAPLAGTGVTLTLDYTNSNGIDRQYTCNNSALAQPGYAVVADNDNNKLSCSTAGTTNTMQFNVHNPFGADTFSAHWNGISGFSNGVEFVAQSFKPTRNGALTKVSFYFPLGRDTTNGTLKVQLKTGLGGDLGTQLATSATVMTFSTVPVGVPTWVDFAFAAPVALTAGQTYYLEIQGESWYNCGNGACAGTLYWGNGAPYSGGTASHRLGGVWSQLTNSLAFQTYLDNLVDVSVAAASDGTTTTMTGGEMQKMRMSLYNRSSSVWEFGGSSKYVTMLSSGFEYNGDDLTIDWPVTTGLANYYDQNGWVSVRVDNYQSKWNNPPNTNLVTDQFSMTFSRTLTTTTDATGAYSFGNLPDGAYTLAISKPYYYPQTASGSLTPGQTLVKETTAMITAPPATLQGNVTSANTGAAAPGVTVTLTDPSGTRSATTDTQGNYLFSPVAYGAYSITFSGPYLQTKTLTGALTPGQAGALDISMTILPITLTITSPANSAIVSANPLKITGTVKNAANVFAYKYVYDHYGNEVEVDYPATVSNGTFAVAVPLAAGWASFGIKATTPYAQYYGQGISITRTPFAFNFPGDNGNIAIAETDGSFDGKNPDGTVNDQPRKALATEYFKTHADTDFLVFLSTFDYAMPEIGAQGFYTTVKNDTQGINQALYDNTAQFGSPGKLQGTIDLGNVTTLAANPYGPKLDETIATMSHELMHRFGAYVRFRNPDGTLNTALLGKDSAHWSYLLDSKGSLMYGNGWKGNSDGTFTATSKQNNYSPLDLYLMGMIDKNQVPPMLLIDNPAIDKTKLPSLGDTVTGTAKTVTIDDIIAAEGVRIPDAASSQKQFNVGFVLLTRVGDSSTAAVQAIETLRKAWAGRFAELTQGKGSVGNIPASLELTVDSPADGATVNRPDVMVSGTVLNTTGAETGVMVNGIPATVSGNSYLANHVPLQLGSNTITITATDANGLTTSSTRTITASTGNYLRISSNIESGTGPLDVSLRLTGSFTVTNPLITYTGPATITIAPGSSTGEFTTKLLIEGTYVITASAIGPDGQTYSDSVTVTVLPRYLLESLLKGKWEEMKVKIAAGDVEGTLGFVATRPKSKYREFFTALGSRLQELNNYLTNIELVYTANSVAKARLYRDEIINGVTDTIEYVIYFVNENGSWKLVQL